MALVRFNPWSEIDTLQRQLNRIFDDVTVPRSWNEFETLTATPAAEMHETNEAIVLKLELPGIKPADLDIEVTEDSVSIKGERKSETKAEDQGVIRSEFRYGSFQRVIPLAKRVKNTDVTAEYKDGILHLTLPKSDAERNRVVKVSVAGANS